MLMEEVFGKLQEYQEILKRQFGIEREVEDIPRALEAQTELLSRIKKTYVEQRDEFEKAEARVRDLKGQLAEAEAAREHAEKQMDGISTQREYEALNKEIRDAGDREQNLRKDLQREERGLAESEEVLRRNEGMIQMQEAEISEKGERVNLEKAEKLGKIESLKADGLRVSEGVDKDIVFKFERIIKNKGDGIVPVKSYVCQGCFMILPSQFVNEVRQGNRIIFCPYCSRVLFHQESGEDTGETMLEIESGSLSDLEDYAEEGEEDSFEDDDDGGDGDFREQGGRRERDRPDDVREDSDD